MGSGWDRGEVSWCQGWAGIGVGEEKNRRTAPCQRIRNYLEAPNGVGLGARWKK
jgi:hypothetical protein